MRGTVLICFLTLIPATDGQDIDTVLFSGAHQTPSATDRTEDPVERRDFAAIFQTKNAAQHHALAVKFVDAHPQSSLLAQAYDIGAKASIDLGNYWTAIDEARFSLRLLPENPILLIQIAYIEAQLGAHETAERDARYAAEFLDEFTNPTTVSDSKWRKWKRELSASAWLAVARSLAARGRTVEALTYIDKSISLNPADKEEFYLRVLVEKSLEKNQHAPAKLPSPEPRNTAHNPIEHEYAGSKWQQGYITPLPDGRLQVLPVQYSGILHRWINYWKIIDLPKASARNSPRFQLCRSPRITSRTAPSAIPASFGRRR